MGSYENIAYMSLEVHFNIRCVSQMIYEWVFLDLFGNTRFSSAAEQTAFKLFSHSGAQGDMCIVTIIQCYLWIHTVYLIEEIIWAAA